ncbi:hypothetical protein [Streptomyces sp. NPDC095613]|uniref:hypothetical protein n=1 Tax=Streptomyces sp. NPDC095613 TaxID=3155540 RepID=UPI00331BB0F8
MSDAIYGLVGALGGAAVAGAVAFWGPLQLQKRALRETVVERDLARAQAAAAQRSDLLRAQVARVVVIRRSIGDWYFLLRSTLDEIRRGHAVDPESFRQSMERVRDDATTALYDALNDGLYIHATRRSYDPEDPLPIRHITMDGVDRREQGANGTRGILDGFEEATEGLTALVDEVARVGIDASQDYEQALHKAARRLETAGSYRFELSQSLMQFVEDISNFTTIETRGTAETGPSGGA